MATVTRSITAVQVASAKASQKFGVITPVKVGADPWWDVLLSMSVAWIPKNATVTSVTLSICGWGTFSGTAELKLCQITSAWTSSVTWSTLPTLVSTPPVASLSRTSPVAGTYWNFSSDDLTALVQSWVSGTATNYGLLIASVSGPLVPLRGTGDSAAPPKLTVTYTVPPVAPTGLSPSSGSVSDAKPILSWDADDDIVEANVQIADDPDSDPDFDGTLSVVSGLFDLSATDYAGLADGDSKVWRVRQRGDGGWSDWSSWASLARNAKPTLSITSPASSTITDGTPPVEWALASGTQVAWQAKLVDANGKVLSDSGRTAGTATAWTPGSAFFQKGLTEDGQTGTIQVWVWDDVDRSAGPGSPVTMYAELDVTLELSSGVSPVDTLAAEMSAPSPVVVLTGTRSEGAPDEVAVFRDGVQVARYTGTDVFDGTNFEIRDVSAPMLTSTTYRVAPITDGAIASGGPTVTLTPTCSGIWLVDDEDPTQMVVVWGGDDQDQSEPEQSIEHVPISSDGPIEVIRRRMVRLPAQGSVSGLLVDTAGSLAADSEAALANFKGNDAGHLYRLVLGRQSYRCIVGNIDTAEQPTDMAGQRVVAVAFDWWAKAVQ